MGACRVSVLAQSGVRQGRHCGLEKSGPAHRRAPGTTALAAPLACGLFRDTVHVPAFVHVLAMGSGCVGFAVGARAPAETARCSSVSRAPRALPSPPQSPPRTWAAGEGGGVLGVGSNFMPIILYYYTTRLLDLLGKLEDEGELPRLGGAVRLVETGRGVGRVAVALDLSVRRRDGVLRGRRRLRRLRRGPHRHGS